MTTTTIKPRRGDRLAAVKSATHNQSVAPPGLLRVGWRRTQDWRRGLLIYRPLRGCGKTPSMLDELLMLFLAKMISTFSVRLDLL